MTIRLGTPEAQRDLTVSLNNAADVARANGDDDQAMALAGEAIELARLVLARDRTLASADLLRELTDKWPTAAGAAAQE